MYGPAGCDSCGAHSIRVDPQGNIWAVDAPGQVIYKMNPQGKVLMQLGRTYREAGKPADAQQTFNRIVQEFPESPFNQEAKRELDSLNKT